jgi:hypothetical protein
MSFISHFNVSQLPDRTVMFLAALRFWTHIVFYFAKMTTLVLGFVLSHTPDSLMLYRKNTVTIEVVDPPNTPNSNESPESSTADTPTKNRTFGTIQILKAMAGDKPITNVIKTIISMNWDASVGGYDNGDTSNTDLPKIIGGLRADAFKFLKSPIVWISYLCDLDTKLSSMSDIEIGQKIRYMLLDFSNKSIYRTSNLSDKESMLFGEIPF